MALILKFNLDGFFIIEPILELFIVNSKFKEEIINDFSRQFYNICEDSIKSFSKDIIEDLQEENMLCSQYTKLLASAKIEYRGETHNLSSLMKYMMDKDRETRIESTKLYYSYFEENEAKFDALFDKLVAVRDKMAKKLGYNSFTELGYIRMNRSDYNEDMIKKLRKEVQDYIVLLCNKLYERQAKRIGIDDFWFADESIEFKSGNATIKGGEEYEKYIIENGKRMYSELSPETAEFFNYMTENELMDLVTRKSKAAGGYCTHIPNYNSPFIFSNFNNTSEDIDVLTHEAGHAFQLYMSRDIEMYEINFPTLDSCEIHSMSMEFITYPWMELFFKEDTLKYKFYHMSSAIKFIPYGVIVDEFQHRIYENPDMSPDERKQVFRDLEKKYLPHRDYRDIDILEKTKDKKRIIIMNKIDLKLNNSYMDDVIKISAKNNEGIEDIKDAIKELFNVGTFMSKNLTFFTNVRQISLLKSAIKSLEDVEQGIKEEREIDMIEIDLKLVWKKLGDIIGANYTEELIDNLFSRFCLGK